MPTAKNHTCILLSLICLFPGSDAFQAANAEREAREGEITCVEQCRSLGAPASSRLKPKREAREVMTPVFKIPAPHGGTLPKFDGRAAPCAALLTTRVEAAPKPAGSWRSQAIAMTGSHFAKQTKQSGSNAAAQTDKGAGSAFLNFGAAEEIDKLNADMQKAFQAGQYDQALSLAQSVLGLCEKNYGKNHNQYAKALNNLGWYEQNAGDFSSARKHFEEALSIMESVMGADNPKLIPVLNNLSMLLAAQGDPDRSCPLLERSLKLEEKVLGTDSVDLANTLNNLAVVYDASGKHKEAIGVLERANLIQAGSSDADPSEKALTLSNLAMIYQADGDSKKAESFLEQAVDLRQKHTKTETADLAELLNNLAMIETVQEKPQQAREHLDRAIAIVEKTLSHEHIDLVPILNNLSSLNLSEGQVQEARKNCLRSSAILDRHINNALPALSFAEQRSFLNARLAAQISLLISSSQSDKEAIESYSYLYKWKGLLIDSLRRQSKLNALSKDSMHAVEVQKLITLRARYTDLFHMSGKMDIEDWKQQSDELLKHKEALERRLSSANNNAGVNDILQSIGPQQFCQLLKPDEVLIDIYFYDKRSKAKTENSYAAFVLDASGEVKLIDLGAANAVNNDCKLWLSRSKARLSNQLEFDKVQTKFGSLKSAIQKEKGKIFVCPDSELDRVPFSLFFEDLLVSHLDAPRELAYLRMIKRQENKEEKQFLAVGGVQFGKHIEALEFAPLPGSLKEVEKLSGLARNSGMKVELLTGDSASKEYVLSAMQKSDFVHLATHGFFSESGISGKSSLLDSTGLGLKSLVKFDKRNPLALSGIIFAADKTTESGQNQILSAEELIGTDLSKCQSLVLSACDTGLGEKDNSQGVLGLRAAIMAAGARMLLISLWKVPDEATVALMEEFYKNRLQKNEPPAQALDHARKTVASKEAFKNTACWGAWVLIGEGW